MTAVRAGVAISHRDQLPSSSRYELLVKIASGGMATVYVGRLSSAVGITRLVAVKRAHAHLLEDPSFGKMLIAEAKLASRIHHPNVVAVQNVEEIEGELLLVMDYVEGASLADLMESPEKREDDQPLPAKVATRVLLDACAGLNAAHELADDDGQALGIVHRDVSPHNILVGVDGIARLTDFGIAKSSGGHTQSAGRTSTGALKGKVAYMAPEYVESGLLDARSDVFSLGIVAWESLTRQRLFRGSTEVESLRLVLAADVPRPSQVAPWLGSALDAVLAKALARAPADRFSSAAELAEALEAAARKDDLLAKHSDVAAFVRAAASDALAQRRALVRDKHGVGAVGPAKANDAPIGRDAQTASIAKSDVRARDGATKTDVSSAPDITSTDVDFGADASTFGSGVSAQLVDEARKSIASGGPAASQRSPRPLLWTVGAALVVIAGVTGAIFVVPATRTSLSSSAASDPTPSSATATPSTQKTPAAVKSESKPIVDPPIVVSATPSASASAFASASASAIAVTTRPTAPGPAPKPRPASPTKPSIITTLPADPPPEKTADKAPPNPYGK